MSLSDHLTPVKQRALITVVIPETRRIEGRLRDGAAVNITVWEVAGAFVWPQVDEVWTIDRVGPVWMLGSRLESFEEEVPISGLEPGHGQIDANVVLSRDGRTFVAVDVSDADDGDDIKWNSSLERFSIIREAALNVEWDNYGASTSKSAAENALAIQSAINALPVSGGTILLPNTYNCDPLSVADRRGITWQGLGGMTAGATAKSGLQYAGSAARFIDARSSTAFWMKDLYLLGTSTAFTGNFIDYSHSAVANDSAYGGMERVQVQGVRTGVAGIRLDKAISMAFHDCKIGGFVRGVTGKDTLGSYSNSITFDGTTFIANVDSHLLNAGEDWRLIGNTYEGLMLPNGTPSGAGALVCFFPVKGLSVIGGWCGDATLSGSWFDVQGNGINIIGTYIGGGVTGVRCDGGITRGLTVSACFDQNTFGIIVDTGGGFAVNSSRLNFQGSQFMTHAAGNRIFWGTYGQAAPVAGAGARGVGEIEWNSAPTAGGKVGWVCTAAGTPGTWKAFGAIDA